MPKLDLSYRNPTLEEVFQEYGIDHVSGPYNSAIEERKEKRWKIRNGGPGLWTLYKIPNAVWLNVGDISTRTSFRLGMFGNEPLHSALLRIENALKKLGYLAHDEELYVRGKYTNLLEVP